MPSHGSLARQPIPDSLLSSANEDPGLFGRMFLLEPLVVGDDPLHALALSMRDKGEPGQPQDAAGDADIPAGFTYLGQFIDHDITFDTTSLTEKIDDPEGRENFRTPALDLDSMYGLGPGGSPHLYERDPVTLRMGAKLLLGTAAASVRRLPADRTQPPTDFVPDLPDHDLLRNPRTGIAIIGDPRNDENLLVAQLHVTFVRFHNRVVDHLRAQGVATPQLFERARRQVTWHYQWIVLHEFLDTITGQPGIADRTIYQGRKFYRFMKFPFMPVEHAVASYRFGHTMVREVYEHNAVFGTHPGALAPATLELLFGFTAKSGGIVGSLVPPALPPNPLPQPVLPSNWVIDWRRFFDFGVPAGTPNFKMNKARRLDPFLTPKLHALPGEGGREMVLPFRNLRRGVMMKLPSGQAVARRMKLPVLTLDQIRQGPDGEVLVREGLAVETPLWYYLLKEAQVLGDGQHLGPVGAQLVAEVLVGLVQGSSASYLGAEPAFTPTLGATPGVFTMKDLITFADAVNPVGN